MISKFRSSEKMNAKYHILIPDVYHVDLIDWLVAKGFSCDSYRLTYDSGTHLEATEHLLETSDVEMATLVRMTFPGSRLDPYCQMAEFLV